MSGSRFSKRIQEGQLKRLFVFFLLFFLSSVNGKAQWADTIKEVFGGTVYPTATFDSRSSFISARSAHIWGIKAGFEFASKLQLGLGYNMLNSEIKKQIPYTTPSGEQLTATGRLHLNFLSVYMRYAYYKTKKWKVSIMPIQIGFGNSWYEHREGLGPIRTGRKFVVIYEPGISASYRVFPWLGAGADFGYRVMLRDNPAIPENFNSPIYSFYVIIYWAEIFKAVFPNSKYSKMM